MGEASIASVLGQFTATYGCMLVMPGPNTFLVLRSTSGRTVSGPLLAAAGIAIGATAAAMVAACAAAALPQSGGLRTLASLVVAALLIRMALGFSAATRSGTPEETRLRTRIEVLAIGFAAALLNPVSVPYFASFFLSHAATGLMVALICGAVFAMAGTWFASLGLLALRVNRIALPPLCRRVGHAAIVGCLIAMAARHLWLAALTL